MRWQAGAGWADYRTAGEGEYRVVDELTVTCSESCAKTKRKANMKRFGSLITGVSIACLVVLAALVVHRVAVLRADPTERLRNAIEVRVVDVDPLSTSRNTVIARLSNQHNSRMFRSLKSAVFRPFPALACIASYRFDMVEPDGSVLPTTLMGGMLFTSGRDTLAAPLPSDFRDWFIKLDASRSQGPSDCCM